MGQGKRGIAGCRSWFILFALFGLALSTPAAAQQRVALVIGNDRYDHVPNLQKAVNDARAVGDHLARLGYEVIRAENATRRQMNEKIGELAGRIGRGDTAAFFFAGHGVALKDANYLLPTDTPAAREGQDDLISRESIAAGSIIDTLQDRGARVVLMILDACRENPFKTAASRGVGGTRGLSQMQTQDGVFVLYSAGIGQTALDRLGDNDANPNSVFTRTLVRLMDQPDLSVQELAKTTQSEVRKLAATVSHFQMPAYYDQIDGVVTLAAKAAKPAPAGPDSGRPFTASVKTTNGEKCLEAPYTRAGEGVGIWSCGGRDSQRWDFVPDRAGYYTVKVRHTGLCLETIDASAQRGTLAWENTCSGSDSQKIKLTPDNAGLYFMVFKNSGLCLTIVFAQPIDGAGVGQWNCFDADYEKWRLLVE